MKNCHHSEKLREKSNCEVSFEIAITREQNSAKCQVSFVGLSKHHNLLQLTKIDRVCQGPPPR